MGKKKIKLPPGGNSKTEAANKQSSDPDAFYHKNPVWSFLYCDFEHEHWGMDCNLDRLSNLLKRLQALQRQTWNEITQDTAGRSRNTKHHAIAVTNIIGEAQERFKALSLHHSFDSIYSLTITGSIRLFGIRTEEVFHIVWMDPNHEICPSPKRHT